MRDFPGSPVVKTQCFQCRGRGFDPCWRNYDPTCCGAYGNIKKKENRDTCCFQNSCSRSTSFWRSNSIILYDLLRTSLMWQVLLFLQNSPHTPLQSCLSKRTKILPIWEFLGGPVVRTLHFHCMRLQVQSLVEELKYLQAVNRSPTKKGYLLLPNVQCKSGWYCIINAAD